MVEDLRSPYTPGEMATSVPGRERDRARYERLLVSVAGEELFQGRIQVLQGPRGVGKTSLLRAVERRAEALGLTSVFVTATADEGLSLVGEGLAAALRDLEPESVTARFLSMVTKIGGKVGPLEAQLELARDAAPEGAVASLKEVVSAVARSRTAARRGLVIFVDEIQEMPPSQIRTLATAWQELDAATKKAHATPVPAVLFAAGLSNAQDVITQGASFGERFRFATVGNLDPEAAAQAVVEPALTSGVTWDHHAVQAILERANGYPYFLQLYADETWNLSSRRLGDRIDVTDARAGIAEAEAQIEHFFRGRWNRATAVEKQMLSALAMTGGEDVDRATVAATMGMKSDAIGMVRSALLGKGLLAAPRHGVLSLNAPGFADFILRQGQE